jgi:CRP-like cAMP-binding protein
VVNSRRIVPREGRGVTTYGLQGETISGIAFKSENVGAPRLLAVLDAGEYFGEIALLEEVPCTATVRARSRCQVLTLDRQQFQNLLSAEPQLREAFERTVHQRRSELEHFLDGRYVASGVVPVRSAAILSDARRGANRCRVKAAEYGD